uniref:Uncharacterized protein n=1 Tax=Sphaerodactylus townsendi TaxID=933632 RepID=A0ACB8FJD6_9SAUR
MFKSKNKKNPHAGGRGESETNANTANHFFIHQTKGMTLAKKKYVFPPRPIKITWTGSFLKSDPLKGKCQKPNPTQRQGRSKPPPPFKGWLSRGGGEGEMLIAL